MTNNTNITVPHFGCSWTDSMTKHLKKEWFRLHYDDFQTSLTEAMPRICESWGDWYKAYKIGWVLSHLLKREMIRLETYNNCIEIVELWKTTKELTESRL